MLPNASEPTKSRSMGFIPWIVVPILFFTFTQNCSELNLAAELSKLSDDNNDTDDDDDDNDGPPPNPKWVKGGDTPTIEDCLPRPADHVTLVEGTLTERYRTANVPNDTTYDFRNLTTTAYPNGGLYPLSLGNDGGTSGICVLGGTVLGQLDRNLTWPEVKLNYDGDGLRIEGSQWYYVDGLRLDNVEDGLSPRGPQDANHPTLYARNLYFTYVRDDCIESDACLPGIVEDSLFDGCYMGISERPGNAASCPESLAGHEFVMDGVLLRLQAMPREDGSDGDAHGHFFKWTNNPTSGKLIVRNSILLAAEVSYSGRNTMGFPDGAVAENVTLVWLGEGDFPTSLPPGVTVTKDIQVWESARSAWLKRHGYE